MSHASTATHGHGHASEVDLLFGVTAQFNTPDELMKAAEKARDAGFKKMDCYSPFPIHGLSEAMGFHCAKVPWAIFFGGIAGFIAGAGLQVYTSVIDYPWNVGGRPKFSWFSFIPVAYECTILLAGLTAVFGMLAINGFPLPYHPIFNTKNFDRASQDGFFICLMKDNDDFDALAAENLLRELKPVNVERVYADEEGKWN